ncbi:hypothetical protein V3C99_015091 [Haemonchus contortus]
MSDEPIDSANGYLTDDDDVLYDSTSEQSEPTKQFVDEDSHGNEGQSSEIDRQNPLNDSMQGVVCATPSTPMDLGELRIKPFSFTSTPISAAAQPGPTLSDSLASLTLDDGSPYGSAADRSRSFIGRNDPPEPLSPFTSRLAADPSSKGKLRDRLLRKALSKSRGDTVPQRVLPFSKPEKSTDVAKHVIELAEDEMVEESVVTTEQSPEPDDIIVLHESENIGRIAETEKKARSRNYADFDVITIESSSDEEKEDDDIVDLETSTEEKSHSQKDVKAIRTVSKFSHDTTGVLEDKLANLNKLSSRPLLLPDGGEKLSRHISDISEEPKEVQEVVVVNDQEQQRPPFPIFNERRPPPPDIIEVVDPQPPLHRFKRDKALQELHKALISQPPAQQLTEAPEGLTVPLKEHQMSGLTWMKWRESLAPGGGILADEMGLGKTLSIIALIVDAKIARKERRRNGKDEQDRERKKRIREEGLIPSNSTLVIAPAALIYHWEAEIKSRCEDHLLKVKVYHNNRRNVQSETLARSDVVITTYTLVANEIERNSAGKGESPLADVHWARIVLDEAHAVKNRKTKASKAVCALVADARWCVTGTPLHNNLWDLYSLMKFLKVDYFSEERFWKEYVASATKNSAERLNLLMKTFVLRREKSFVSPVSEKPLVELPEKHSYEHMLEFTDSERKAYDLMYEASRARVREMVSEEEADERFGARVTKKRDATLTSKNVFLGSAANSNPNSKFGKMGCMLVILLRLRQACIHFFLTKNAVDMEAFQSIGFENPLNAEEQENLVNLTIDKYIGSNEVENITDIFEKKYVSAKIKLALELLRRILEDGEKCVIVSQWTSFLKILEEHINKQFPQAYCSTICGETLPIERQNRVNSFNEDADGIVVMLISITAGGVGLNLTGGNHLILMDLHWNPALELQARDRIHRMGQTREVHLHKIIMKGSIEERVLQLQMKKMELANNVLKGAVSKKNMNLSMADLKFLFDLDAKK